MISRVADEIFIKIGEKWKLISKKKLIAVVVKCILYIVYFIIGSQYSTNMGISLPISETNRANVMKFGMNTLLYPYQKLT